MAFKERFKDRNIITGKNGENAQLVPTGPPGGPKKGAKDIPAVESPPQFLQQAPPFAVKNPTGLGPMMPPPFGQAPGGMMQPMMQPPMPTFKVLNSSPPPPAMFAQQPQNPIAPVGALPAKQPMMPFAQQGGPGQGTSGLFQPPQFGGMGQPQQHRPNGGFQPPLMAGGALATPQPQMTPTPMPFAQGGPFPAALVPPAAGPSRLSMVAPGNLQQQQKVSRAPSFMAPQPQSSPSLMDQPNPTVMRQPSFLGGPGAPPSFMPMPSFGAPAPSNGPSNVGTYNYQQASQATAAQANPAESPSSKEAVVKHGRRAGSTDPQGRKKQDNATGGEGNDERPNTDPQKPSFKPYTLEDYRKMKEETAKMVLRKGLGPVDNDEVRAEREKRQKMLGYAANANKINKVLECEADPDHERKPIVQPIPQDVLERQQRREKALEFAKHVPKPKVRPKEEVSPAPGHAGENLDELAAASDQNAAKREKEKMLLDLEAKHKRDQLMIENIKKQLKLA